MAWPTKASEFFLKIGDGETPTEGFISVGSFCFNKFTINNETGDATSKGSGGMRDLLGNAGVQSMSISGSGVFVDDAAFHTARTAVMNKDSGNWQVIVPALGTYEGAFMITSVEMGGEHNGEVTYSTSLESAGAITFTAASD